MIPANTTTRIESVRSTFDAHWHRKQFPLAAGNVALHGGAAFLDLATTKVVPASASGSGMLFLGFFAEPVDASTVEKLVDVAMPYEFGIALRYLKGPGITSGDVGKLCYFEDDQTVTLAAGRRVLAGRIFDVQSRKGVGIDPAMAQNAVRPLVGPDLFFIGNDATPADIVHGATYEIPTTAGVSTVTLPAAAADGTVAHFFADGAKNGHTVQYRDATGPVNLTAALTASKRHVVTVTKIGGKWGAASSVSP